MKEMKLIGDELGPVWSGTVRSGGGRFGLAWYDKVWYGPVRYGGVWRDKLRQVSKPVWVIPTM